MWYGKTTPELEILNNKYYEKFGWFPYGHEELEFTEDEYDEYVALIKEAIETGKDLTKICDWQADE